MPHRPLQRFAGTQYKVKERLWLGNNNFSVFYNLQKLNTIKNNALRLVTCAAFSTHVSTMKIPTGTKKSQARCEQIYVKFDKS